MNASESGEPLGDPGVDTGDGTDENAGEDSRAQRLRDVPGAAFRKVEASAPPSVATRIRAFRERIRHRRTLDTVWRMSVFALGVTLLCAGLIMFVVPGPGFATIILGLVILGSEFAWATRVLDPVKSAAQRAAQAAMDPQRRKRNLVLAAIAGVLAGLTLWWYLASYGLTLHPIMDLLSDIAAWVRGLFE